MPQRLGLRAWLEKQIDSGKYKGVQWVDKNKGQFVIPWKHASRHGWLENEDAALFKAWAVYTKKFVEARGDCPNPKTWKANFRCAVNALPDIQPVSGQHNKKGKNACRVFEFSKKRKSRETVCQREVPTKIPELGKRRKSDSSDQDSPCRYGTRTKTRKLESGIKMEPGIEYGSCIQQQNQHTNNWFPNTVKQEHGTNEIKLETDDHCYPIIGPCEAINPLHYPALKDILNITQLPPCRDYNQPHFYPSDIPCSYDYTNFRPSLSSSLSSSSSSSNTSVYQSDMTAVDNVIDIYPEISSIEDILRAAEFVEHNKEKGSPFSEYLNDSDEESMANHRPGSVGSSLSDAELQELLVMPKEEDCNEYDSQTTARPTLDYFSTISDPFLSEKAPRDNIRSFTQLLFQQDVQISQ